MDKERREKKMFLVYGSLFGAIKPKLKKLQTFQKVTQKSLGTQAISSSSLNEKLPFEYLLQPLIARLQGYKTQLCSSLSKVVSDQKVSSRVSIDNFLWPLKILSCTSCHSSSATL